MAWNLVAHDGASATTDPTTPSMDTTGCDLLVVAVCQYNGSPTGTLTDSKGNTWGALAAQTGGSETYSRLFYVQSPVVGTGHTFSYVGTNIYGGLIVQAWSGAALSLPFDQENGAGSGSASSLATGSITPSQNNELIVTGFCVSAGSSGNSTIDGGFTVNAEQFPYSPGVSEGHAMASLVQTTAAAANPTWTVGAGPSTGGLAAAIASFKMAAAGDVLLMGQILT